MELLSEMHLATVNMYFFTSRSLASELERNTLSIAPLLTITVVLMLVSTVVEAFSLEVFRLALHSGFSLASPSVLADVHDGVLLHDGLLARNEALDRSAVLCNCTAKRVFSNRDFGISWNTFHRHKSRNAFPHAR